MHDRPRLQETTSVLVTGASGFLGAALIKRLREQGYALTALSRLAPAAVGAQWTQVRNYDESCVLFPGHACVVHLAARVHVMNDTAQDPLTEFRAINVDLTASLARKAAAAGVRRFIYMSSVKVNGEATVHGRAFGADSPASPQDPYGISKMEAELALRAIAAETGMEVVIIRPPLVYGPGVKANFATMARWVRKGIPLPLGAIHNRRSLVGLDNLVDLVVTCLHHPQAANQTFMASDGHDLSTTDLLRGLALAMGRPARLVSVPQPLVESALRWVGRGDWITRLCGNLQVDISHTCRALEWTPPLTVEESLRRAVAHNTDL